MKHQRPLQLLALILAGLLWAAATALSGAQAPEVRFWSENRAPAGQPVPAGVVPRGYGPADLPADCPVGTPLSIDFLGQESTLDGELLPVGAVVRACDPTGLVVGCDPVLKDEYERIHVELRACTLAGDFNCGCRVDAADIQGVAARWGIVQGQEGYYPPGRIVTGRQPDHLGQLPARSDTLKDDPPRSTRRTSTGAPRFSRPSSGP